MNGTNTWKLPVESQPSEGEDSPTSPLHTEVAVIQLVIRNCPVLSVLILHWPLATMLNCPSLYSPRSLHVP